MRTKTGRVYNDEDVTFCQLDRNFPKSINQELKQEIKDKLLSAVEPKQQQDFLKCVARSIAGHYGDKVWYIWLGARNSGKGSLQMGLNLSFGANVITTNPPLKTDESEMEKYLGKFMHAGCDRGRLTITNEVL